MNNCLILGANGFIGSHLTDALVAKGYHVRAFDKYEKHLVNFKPDPKIEIVNGDFLNRRDLKKAVVGVDYVFHFISTTNPMTAENDPLIDIETNVKMSIELFQECAQQRIKKVIFASTGGAIYGDSSNLGMPISEDTIPKPISPYAIGKLSIEHYLQYFERKLNQSSLVYRISNPYGERQSLKSKQGVIPIFLQQIAQGQPITIFGNGNMVRDYIYVKDVAFMIASSFNKAKHNLYNLGSGKGITISKLVSEIKPVVKRPLQIIYSPNPLTFVEKVILDVSRFEKEFNLHPRVKLREGISKTWQYVLSKNAVKE